MSERNAADGAQRGRRWVLWSVAAALVVISTLALVVVALPLLLFPDIDDAAPGSLAWYLVLPRFLTAAPTPAACGEPRYALHFIDGEKPQSASVKFQTRASLAELRTAYARELTACAPEAGAAEGRRFQCDRSQYDTVVLSLDPGDGCRRAQITFLSR